MNDTKNVSPKLLAYLQSWHQTSTSKKAKQGIQVNLTFEQFFELFEPRQLNSLQAAIDANRIRYFMAKDNDFAFVLTWRSYAACSTGIFDPSTACITSRLKSRQINTPKSGDKLRAAHKQAISQALTGLEKSDDHKKALSEATKGKKKTPWTQERKDARAAQRQAQEAAKRKQAEHNGWTNLASKEAGQ